MAHKRFVSAGRGFSPRAEFSRVAVVASAIPSSGLQAWYKADSLALGNGANVNTLPDSSALNVPVSPQGLENGGNPTTPPTFLTNQIHGLPVIRLPNQYGSPTQWSNLARLAAVSANLRTQPATYWMICRPFDTTSSVKTMGLFGLVDWPSLQNGVWLQATVNPAGTGIIAYRARTAGADTTNVAGGSFTEFVVKQYCIVCDGTNATMYENGVAVATNVSWHATPGAAVDFVIGARAMSSGGYDNTGALIDFCEYAQWNRALSAAEVAQITTYGQRWQ